MSLCLVFNFKVCLCSEARNYTINGSISKNLSNLNDLNITFMKYNWLKPISFTIIFEFEVDPYMEWLYNSSMCISLRPSTYVMGSSVNLGSFGSLGSKGHFHEKCLNSSMLHSMTIKTQGWSAWDPLLMLCGQMSIQGHLGSLGSKGHFH